MLFVFCFSVILKDEEVGMYCNRFEQSIARQRLSKHFPICNNIEESVFSMWSVPSKCTEQ
jgi:hypothetical protein